MLFYSSLREIPEITPPKSRLILYLVDFFSNYLNTLTTLQHLNNYLNASTLQNFKPKIIGKSERKNTADHICQTLHLRGILK